MKTIAFGENAFYIGGYFTGSDREGLINIHFGHTTLNYATQISTGYKIELISTQYYEYPVCCFGNTANAYKVNILS
jgi:hypothetical protein